MPSVWLRWFCGGLVVSLEKALIAEIETINGALRDAMRAPDDAGATQFIAPVRIVHAPDDAVRAQGDAMRAQGDAVHTNGVADARAQALQMVQEGMSATQIARALDVKTSTVRSWLRRAQQSHATTCD